MLQKGTHHLTWLTGRLLLNQPVQTHSRHRRRRFSISISTQFLKLIASNETEIEYKECKGGERGCLKERKLLFTFRTNCYKIFKNHASRKYVKSNVDDDDGIAKGNFYFHAKVKWNVRISRHAGFLDGFLNMHRASVLCICVCAKRVYARLLRIEAHNYATAWMAIKTIQRIQKQHIHTHTRSCICSLYIWKSSREYMNI